MDSTEWLCGKILLTSKNLKLHCGKENHGSNNVLALAAFDDSSAIRQCLANVSEYLIELYELEQTVGCAVMCR